MDRLRAGRRGAVDRARGLLRRQGHRPGGRVHLSRNASLVLAVAEWPGFLGRRTPSILSQGQVVKQHSLAPLAHPPANGLHPRSLPGAGDQPPCRLQGPESRQEVGLDCVPQRCRRQGHPHLPWDEAGGYYIHIDDTAVITGESQLTESATKAIGIELESLGFVLKRDTPMGTGRYIGLTPQVSPARWIPEASKLGSFDRLLEMCEQAICVDVAIVEASLGLYVWCCLLWRPAMPMARAIVQFTQAHQGKFCKPWATVRQEIGRLRGFLPMVAMDVGFRDAPVVLAQDSARASSCAKTHR